MKLGLRQHDSFRTLAQVPVIFGSILLFALAVRHFCFAAANPAPREQGAEVRVLEMHGTIDPLSARYLGRELRNAADTDLVIIRLDTPGGLERSMREITQKLLASPTPVVVYVSPAGARAASAGLFVTLAANVAAMAPGTNIGAAHPISIGTGKDNIQTEKVVNDSAAFARAVAQARGRNVEWAERAVRESVSITEEEALRQNVIDLVASDTESLLRQLDGRSVTTAKGPVTLSTAGAVMESRSMNLAEQVLQILSDPNIAYILFTLGLIGLAAELYNPGLLFPGIVGAICLILGLVAFGNLPVNWGGVALVGLAIALLIAELYTESMGILAAGGVTAFVLGSLMLYRPVDPSLLGGPDLRVSRWLIVAFTGLFIGFFLFVLRSVARGRRSAALSGPESLIGRTAVAASELAPLGRVRLRQESWQAESINGSIPSGNLVEVVALEGVTLKVRMATKAHKLPGNGTEGGSHAAKSS